jgi:hypothetical protein
MDVNAGRLSAFKFQHLMSKIIRKVKKRKKEEKEEKKRKKERERITYFFINL